MRGERSFLAFPFVLLLAKKFQHTKKDRKTRSQILFDSEEPFHPQVSASKKSEAILHCSVVTYFFWLMSPRQNVKQTNKQIKPQHFKNYHRKGMQKPSHLVNKDGSGKT